LGIRKRIDRLHGGPIGVAVDSVLAKAVAAADQQIRHSQGVNAAGVAVAQHGPRIFEGRSTVGESGGPQILIWRGGLIPLVGVSSRQKRSKINLQEPKTWLR